jgi:hypothetical protein
MSKTGIRNEPLNVQKVLQEFEEAEREKTHRKGTFRIDRPFEEALDTLLRPRPKTRTAAALKKV